MSNNIENDPLLDTLFTGVEEAKASTDSNYVRAGHYLARIDRVKADKTRPPAMRPFVAVEMSCLHAFADGELSLQHNGEEWVGVNKWHRPGEGFTDMKMADQDPFLGNMKALIAGVMGVDPNQVTEQDCKDVCKADQPLAGMVIEIRARDIVTKNGKPFTKVTYVREYPAETLQDVLSEDILNAFFPGDSLAELIESQNQEG